jgi:hypothetical protein
MLSKLLAFSHSLGRDASVPGHRHQAADGQNRALMRSK